jgi:Fur family ferric uptake transcriptional regulator
MTHITTDYAARIRQGGFRLTPQRRIILDAICESSGHVTPDAIYTRVQARLPGVNRATVYRNLDFLCEMRLIVAARIGRHTVYEIAGAQPHHHLICRACNRAIQLPHASLLTLFQDIEREHGFTVDMDHLTLFGLCPDCRSGPAARRKK